MVYSTSVGNNTSTEILVNKTYLKFVKTFSNDKNMQKTRNNVVQHYIYMPSRWLKLCWKRTHSVASRSTGFIITVFNVNVPPELSESSCTGWVVWTLKLLC